MFTEFRLAARSVLRWRAGAFAAVATLAIGIGVTTASYGLGRMTREDLSGVPETGRIARIYAASEALGVGRAPVTFGEFRSTLSRVPAFSAVGAYADEDALLGPEPDPRPIVAGYASPGFFSAMQVPPVTGRLFVPDDLEASEPVAILSYPLWRRLFPDGPTGGTVVVDGIPRRVVGVMPPEFHYHLLDVNADLWIPLGARSPATPAIVGVFARLRRDVDWHGAGTELSSLAKPNTPWTWRAIPLGEDARAHAIDIYALTLGPGLLVLLLACINVGCLLLARGLDRDKELTVRRALGATRAQVVRSLLFESLVVALVAGGIGAGLGLWMVRATGGAQGPLGMAGPPIGFGALLPAAGAGAGMAVLGALWPAFRLSKRDVAASLNGPRSRRRSPVDGYGVRDLIAFAEVACSVGLVVWAAMIVTLFGELGKVAFTFPADRVVAMRVSAADAMTVERRVAAVAGVTSVTESSAMLAGGAKIRVATDDGRTVIMATMPVGRRFFSTLGVAILQGRGFTATETQEASGAAIVSETAARELAPDGRVLGMRLHPRGRSTPAVTVVGVCRDPVAYGALARAGIMTGEIYVPSTPAFGETTILARVTSDPHALLPLFAAAARVRPGARPVRAAVLSDDWQRHNGDRDPEYAAFRTFEGFALLMLLLAASGIFAVVSQTVTLRTTEFGVRMVLGAPARSVRSMVLGRETKLIGAAIASGVLVTLGVTRVGYAELVRLNVLQPSTWLAAIAMTLAAAAVAVALATRRILRLDPSAVLRRL